MTQPLDYRRPDRIRPELPSLLIGGGVLVVALVLASTCLDEGELFLSATARLSVAYWCGVIVVLARRANSLTAGDHRYFRLGLIPLLVLGIPATLATWSHWGIG